MNSIPQEIVDCNSDIHFEDQVKDYQLISYADLLFNRLRLATISRKWQWAIERQIFSYIFLKSTYPGAFE